MRLPAFKKLNENLALFLINRNFYKRTVTAIIFGGITIYVMATRHKFSSILLLLVYFGCMAEWLKIILTSNKRNIAKFNWLMAGTVFISAGSFFLSKICNINSQCLLVLCGIIWTSDIGAYIVGNLIKGPKLIPKVSPNKTWSGAIGGLFLASCMGVILINYFPEQSQFIAPFKNHYANLLYVLMIIIVGQIGDLIESYAKRCFNIRDSSQIIPGHGGMLDRCDSILAVGIILLILNIL